MTFIMMTTKMALLAAALSSMVACVDSGDADRQLLFDEPSHAAGKADGVEVDTWAYYSAPSGDVAAVGIARGKPLGELAFGTTVTADGLDALVIEGAGGGRFVLREDNIVEENTLAEDPLTLALMQEFADEPQGAKADEAVDECQKEWIEFKKLVAVSLVICGSLATFATPGSGLACIGIYGPIMLGQYKLKVKKYCAAQ